MNKATSSNSATPASAMPTRRVPLPPSASLAAMQLKKHVQCQKPLTHTVFEARQMQLAARKYGVVTQMGNQIQSHSAYRTAVAAVHAGAIGKVREVHSWQPGKPTWR